MTTICSPSILPTFNELYTLLPNIPSIPSIPPLPSLRSPIYNNLNIPNLQNINILQELQSYQLLSIFKAIFDPLIGYLGLSLADILPKIPGIDMTLIDLLAFDVSKLYLAIPNINLNLFPNIPIPLFNGMSFPQVELVLKANLIISSYMSLMVATITNLISSVTDDLQLPGLPTIPSIPSFDTLKALMMTNFPGFDNLSAILLSGVSLNQLFNFSIPGFPSLPALPTPLIPHIQTPQIELLEGLKILNNHLTTYPLQIITDFCNDTLSMLGFSFPTICIIL